EVPADRLVQVGPQRRGSALRVGVGRAGPGTDDDKNRDDRQREQPADPAPYALRSHVGGVLSAVPPLVRGSIVGGSGAARGNNAREPTLWREWARGGARGGSLSPGPPRVCTPLRLR